MPCPFSSYKGIALSTKDIIMVVLLKMNKASPDYYTTKIHCVEYGIATIEVLCESSNREHQHPVRRER